MWRKNGIRAIGRHVAGIAAAVLLGVCGPADLLAQSATPLAPLVQPSNALLSDVEITLMTENGDGCFGRCIRYTVVVRGDGEVRYEDRGTPPQEPTRMRRISPDVVVLLINQFLEARFLDARAEYRDFWFARRVGERIEFLAQGGIGAPWWTLTLRLGNQAKEVRLYGNYPAELERLRDRVIVIGGPEAWR